MYLLDTDVLIWILRGQKRIIEWASKTKDTSPLSISVIAIAEIYKNIFPAELTSTEEFLREHIIFSIDPKIARLAGLYWQQYHLKLKNLSLTDCLVAGTANAHDLTLVSLNLKHFPMKDLRTVNPLSP